MAVTARQRGRHRRRRVLRRVRMALARVLFLLLLLVGALLIGLAALLQSEDVGRAAITEALPRVNELLPGRVELGRYGGALGHHIVLEDITIYDERDVVAAQARRLEVWWSFWDLLRGRVGVSRVELERPELLVEVREDGTVNWVSAFVAPKPAGWVPPPTSPKSSPLVVDVAALEITDATIAVDLRGQQRFEFSGVGLNGSYTLARGRHDIALRSLAVKTDAPWDLPVATLRAEAVLDDLDLIVDALRLEVDGNVVEVDGRLTQLDRLRFDSLHVKSPGVDLDFLKRFSPKSPLQRSVTLELWLDGRLDALSARGEIGGELGRIGLSDVLVGLTKTPLTHAATLDIDGFKLAELLPYAGLPKSVTADIRWAGQGTGLDSLGGDLTVDAGPFAVQGVRLQGHSLRAHLEDGVITAHHRDLVGGGTVEGDATVWLNEGRFAAQKTTFSRLRLSTLRTITKGGVRDGVASGWVAAQGAWAERPFSLVTDGELLVHDLQVPSTSMAQVRAGWTDLELVLGGGVPSLRGSADVRVQSLRTNGTEQAREIRLHAALAGATAQIETVVTRSSDLIAELDGEVDWSELPTVKLRGDRLQVLAGTLLAATPEGEAFSVKARAGSVQLDRLQLHAGDVRLTAQGMFDPKGPLRAQVRLSGVDLGPTGELVDVLPLLPAGPQEQIERLGLAGDLKEVFARIDGSLIEPELELRLTARDLVVSERPPLALDVAATLGAEGLRGEVTLDTLLSLSVEALPASLSFGPGRRPLTLAPDGEWDIELVLPDTSVGRVAGLARQDLPDTITSGHYSGGMTWRGTTAAPDIRAALSVADVTIEGRSRGTQDVERRALNAKLGATIQEGRLSLPSSFLRTDKEGRILVVEGGAEAPLGEFLLARFGPDADPSAPVPPFRALELGLAIKNLPMSLTHVFVPALKPLSGSVTGELRLGGELAAPEATADLRLIGGRAGTQELKTAKVGVTAIGDALSLDVLLEAKLGGQLAAHGGVTFPLRPGSDMSTLLDHDDLDVQIAGDGFPIAVLLAFVPNTYDVSGELSLLGVVTGTLRRPVPDVAVVLPDGRLCHEKTWICYENVHLDAAVEPGRFTITDASFKTFPRSRNPLAVRTWNKSDKVAGGFTLDGFAELDALSPGYMKFDVELDHMWASSEETMQAQLDGGLSVEGTFPAIRIAGDIDLENVVVDIGHEDIGRSLAPMELPENLVVHRVTSRRGPGERRPSVIDRGKDPSRRREIVEALDVDVGIHMTNNVNVKLAVGLAGQGPAKVFNTLGRVEPDLTLKGDVRVLMVQAQPRLEGRIETSRGSKLTALTKKFMLQDGSGVDLIGDPLASQLDFTGVHSTRYGDVRVLVTGSVQNPQIVFESDEFEDQADIMALLVTGKPLSELTAAQGSSAMSGVGAALTGWVSNTFGKYVPVDLLEVDLGEDFSSGSVQAGKAITPWLFVLSRFRWGAEDDENTIEGQVELAFPGTRNLYLEVVIGDKLVGSVELIYKVLF